MGRKQNVDLAGDPEYEEFTNMLENSGRSNATKKSYRTSYRKLRDLLGKNIADTAQDTTAKAIMASTDQINSAQALINIAVLVREQMKKMPIDILVEQRSTNKADVIENLKQANLFTILPELDEFDTFIENLWKRGLYREYIVNYLIRHHYVRNLDLIFDIVETKKETLADPNLNYLWLDRKKQIVHYIRNSYKTAKTYGQKVTKIDNERFLYCVKKCFKQMYCFPLLASRGVPADNDKIGYYIKKLTFNELGEGACLKIIVNHYKDDISRLMEISKSRGTNLHVLLTSYNISFDGISDEKRNEDET